MTRFLLLALVAACASGKQVRATVLDAEGRPLPGALLYWEAYQPFSSAPRAFDFAFAVTGPDGAPDKPRPLRWKAGAGLTIAALAEGYVPQVVYLRGGPVLAEQAIDGPVFRLSRGPAWTEELASLSFPFSGNDELSRRAAASEPVRRAFARAAAQVPAQATAAEQEKKAAIEAIH